MWECVCEECVNGCMCPCIGGDAGWLESRGPSKISLLEGLSSVAQCGEWACPGREAFASHVQRGAPMPPRVLG